MSKHLQTFYDFENLLIHDLVLFLRPFLSKPQNHQVDDAAFLFTSLALDKIGNSLPFNNSSRAMNVTDAFVAFSDIRQLREHCH